MSKNTAQNNRSRIGMHYFPNHDHFTEEDLQTWLPKLQALGAGWLTLNVPSNRAIPEHFLRGLIEAGIEPVLQFDCRPETAPQPSEIAAMLNAYASWGVQYVSLFERPNSKDTWSGAMWARTDLVDRFVDLFVPYAEQALQAGLIPVFPPLEPGGDYWDTAFLRSSLQKLTRDGHSKLLDRMVLGVYAWAGDASLNWGAGGPERWAGSRPYTTPEGEQDQLGFRIFDWYSAVSEAVLGRSLPMLIMAGGSAPGKGRNSQTNSTENVDHTMRNRHIAMLMADENEAIPELEPVPAQVLCCNFWLLAAEDCCSNAKAAWYEADGQAKPAAEAIIAWHSNRTGVSVGVENSKSVEETVATESREVDKKVNPPADQLLDQPFDTQVHKEKTSNEHSIQHYLLLPTYEWGVADWHLDVIRPFVKKYQPTVGYSIDEAAKAAKVTVVGGAKSFSLESMAALKANGRDVLQIEGDGTVIATQLENL